MARQSLTKAQREQRKRQAIMAANQREFDALMLEGTDYAKKLTKALGPKADRGGSSRERLKAGSYGVGFQGPRGFNTPKDYVTKREQAPGLLAPIDANRPTFGANGSKRFAGDTAWGAKVPGYDYRTETPSESVMRKLPGQKGWKKV